MGTEEMTRAIFAVAIFAAALAYVSLASEVEDLGAQPVKTAPARRVGEAAKTKTKARAGTGNWGGSLMTSGSFTMMASSGINEEEERERDELGEANDWDHSMGKCVKFAADSKCAPQCFHQGKTVDETEDGAVCTKICRVPGANGAQCNVIKMVMPMHEESKDLGEVKTMYLTKSKVMQAGLRRDNQGEADPMACAGVATNRRQ